ncbi:hypothetical protein P4O66_018385 [Electrophorus voltai]|uniref:Uncharacterized protein n=1 Tax=Electrophorus voltai TaxID=2609070 RepID=A0AAD8YSF6_9TELE|nr:hypothetical protein P4O66_018385 [Electrophorus voltai]
MLRKVCNNKRSYPCACAGSYDLKARLLQLATCWSSSKSHQTSTTCPECSTGLQSSKVHTSLHCCAPLYWLLVAACIRFKTVMLAYKAKNGPASPYMMTMLKTQSTPRVLRTSSMAWLETPYFKS